jgi:hypothetical protein
LEPQLHELKLQLTELLQNLIIRIESIVPVLHDAEQTREANGRLSYLIEDISVAAQSVFILRDTYAGLDLDELNIKLTALAEQMEVENYPYLSDLLEFDLKPLFEYWSGQLQDA